LRLDTTRSASEPGRIAGLSLAAMSAALWAPPFLPGTQCHELLDCLILGEQHLHTDSLPPQGQDDNNDDHDDNDRPDTYIHG
jgi:hypothetical protein